MEPEHPATPSASVIETSRAVVRLRSELLDVLGRSAAAEGAVAAEGPAAARKLDRLVFIIRIGFDSLRGDARRPDFLRSLVWVVRPCRAAVEGSDAPVAACPPRVSVQGDENGPPLDVPDVPDGPDSSPVRTFGFRSRSD